MMNVLASIEDTRSALQDLKANAKTLAFVPTMGNLHAGHLSLVKHAKSLTDKVIVSIFVNPLQFGANEDLATYPRTLEDDLSQLKALNVDYVFTPNESIMYPNGKQDHTQITVPKLTDLHCGQSRPQFFGGITTVVTKLFNIVQADVAVFGEKDFQQLAVIKKMVADLNMPIQVVGQPIFRENDGLAMSSRNGYLSQEERAKAPLLYKTLTALKNKLLEGEDFAKAFQNATDILEKNGFVIDYLNLTDANTLQLADDNTADAVILAAAALGKTRLIDNITLKLKR